MPIRRDLYEERTITLHRRLIGTLGGGVIKKNTRRKLPLKLYKATLHGIFHYQYKGGSRTGVPGAPPPLVKKIALGLVNFHCIYANTLILVNMQCLQYVYITTPLTKTQGMCDVNGASKQTLNLRILLRRDRPPPFMKFLNPPLESVNAVQVKLVFNHRVGQCNSRQFLQ